MVSWFFCRLLTFFFVTFKLFFSRLLFATFQSGSTHPLINSLKVSDFQVFASFLFLLFPLLLLLLLLLLFLLLSSCCCSCSFFSAAADRLSVKLSDEGFPVRAHTSNLFASTTWHLKISTLLLLWHFSCMKIGIWKYQHFFLGVIFQKIGFLCGRRISYSAVYNDLHILWENQIYETTTLFTGKGNISGYFTTALKNMVNKKEFTTAPKKHHNIAKQRLWLVGSPTSLYIYIKCLFC